MRRTTTCLRERYDAYLAGALKGEASPFLEEPPVHVHAQGRQEWLTAKRWPLREVTPVSFHLTPATTAGADGTLSAQPPAALVTSTWRTDPTTADGMTFLTAPLQEPLQMMGPITVQLALASGARDMAVYAMLFMRPADGSPDRETNLIGCLRRRFRDGPGAAPDLLAPGERFTVKLTFGRLGYVAKRGERLGLMLSSAMPGLLVPNPQTSEPIAGAQSITPAVHTLFSGPGAVSRLLLHVLPQEPDRAHPPLRRGRSIVRSAARHRAGRARLARAAARRRHRGTCRRVSSQAPSGSPSSFLMSTRSWSRPARRFIRIRPSEIDVTLAQHRSGE